MHFSVEFFILVQNKSFQVNNLLLLLHNTFMSDDSSSSETEKAVSPISIKMGQILRPTFESKRVRFVSPDISMGRVTHSGFTNSKTKVEIVYNVSLKTQMAYNITVVIYLTTTSSFTFSVFGFLLTEQYRLIIGSGVIVATFAIGASGLVALSGKALTHTAVLQGYLILGILAVMSLLDQIGIVALLTEVKRRKYRNYGDLATWIEFLGGAQWVMATMAGIIVVASFLLTCCSSSLSRDSAVNPVVSTT